jgi:hypothetical protein
VNVFHAAAPAPVDHGEVAAAERMLSELPLDTVPDLAGVPAGSRMPFSRNRLFVGRENDLRALAAALKAGGAAAVGQSPAVTGGGGVGKTQLASEFVYRYGQYFAAGVFWLNLSDAESVPVEVAACGGPTGMNLHPEFDQLPLDTQVGMVAAEWANALPRLLVFDNCEAELLLEMWRPRGGGCRVLVTTRRGEWSEALGVETLPLGTLPRPESIALLREHRSDLDNDDPDLDAIAHELGDLPLALHLAGNYLHRYRLAPFGDPAAYLKAIRRPDILGHRSLTVGGETPVGHEQHVARTFAVSYERLDGEAPEDILARSALARAAWFAPGEPIPPFLLRRSLAVDESDEDGMLCYEDGLARLVGLGLVERGAAGETVLHRLVAAFVQGRVVYDRTTAAAVVVLLRLVASFVRGRTADDRAALTAVEEAVAGAASEQNQAGVPGSLLAWQPHLRAVAERARKDRSRHAGWLLSEVGNHLRMVADLDGAKTAYEQSLAIYQATSGPNHPNVATAVNNLCLVLQEKGDLDGLQAAQECETACNSDPC